MNLDKELQTGHIISRTAAYTGPIFTVAKQVIQTPDGLTVNRDLIEHAPAVVILALTADGTQALINYEYRVGVNREAVALPAGLVNAGEQPAAAATRELAEETGYVVQSLQRVLSITASEGMTDEVQHCYVATIDPNQRTERHFDTDEFVTTELVPFADIIEAIKSGVITSAQTIALVSYYVAFMAK